MKRSLVLNAKNLWEYIAIGALILECSSIYFYQTQGFLISSNYILIIGFLPLTLQGILYLIQKEKSRRLLLRAIVYYLFFVLLYAVTLGKAELINFMMKFGVIFPCIGVYSLYLVDSSGFYRFTKRFVRIVFAIAIISLIIWILGPICGVLKPTGTVMYTWGNMTKRANSYFNIQFATQMEQTVFGVWRNTAFFTEAPKYGLILSTAYIFNYIFDNDNKKIAICLLLTIITTFSFTAIIAVILVHFIEYSMNVGRDILSGKTKIRTIIWPITISIVLVLFNFLIGNKLDTSSGVGRVGDFVVCFSVGMHHPVFGWGFLDNEYLNTVLHTSRLASGVGNTMGLSNSICQIFVDGGLYLVGFYLMALIGIVCWGKKYNLKLFSSGIVFLYFIITTYFAYTGIMFSLISFGYVFIVYRNSDKLHEFYSLDMRCKNGR